MPLLGDRHALDRRMVTLERQPVTAVSISGKAVQQPLPFERPELTVAIGYRASIRTHRWLRRRSRETGRTMRDLIDDALKAAGGPG